MKIMELYPLFNRICKFLNLTLPPRVFIHPFRIGGKRLDLFFARLVRSITPYSTFYYDVLFTSLFASSLKPILF